MLFTYVISASLVAVLASFAFLPGTIGADALTPCLSNLTNIQNELATVQDALAYQRTQRKQLMDRITALEKKALTSPCTDATVSQLIEEAMNNRTRALTRYREQQKVYFSVKVGSSITNLAAWQTIVFNTVESNQGNAYSSTTGEFTAPIDGWYVFFSHILSKARRTIETSLQVNGVNKMYLYSAGTGSAHGSGSNMVVVHLSAGDVVKMVKHGHWGTSPFYVHNSWSSFSGFLLSTD